VPVVNFTESKELNLATVIPHIIAKEKKSIIICQSWIPGELQIDLYSTGGEKISNLYKGKIEAGKFIMTWDGKDPVRKAIFKGDYKIRWTIGEGYREFPVSIK
jgi:flagellar hook assembly protein FlgD